VRLPAYSTATVKIDLHDGQEKRIDMGSARELDELIGAFRGAKFKFAIAEEAPQNGPRFDRLLDPASSWTHTVGMPRSYKTDYLLWALSAAAVFAALGFVSWDRGGCADLWVRCGRLLAGETRDHQNDNLGFVVGFWSLMWAVAAIPIGWSCQAALVMSGVRLTGRNKAESHSIPSDPPGEQAGT
jgi:hypothetical protein